LRAPDTASSAAANPSLDAIETLADELKVPVVADRSLGLKEDSFNYLYMRKCLVA
jgi:hypothetical protein